VEDRDEEFLDMIAYQARVTYATQQLATCQITLHHWQQCTEESATASEHAKAQHNVTYYSQQVAHWQTYLTALTQAQQAE
jgi:hypothetical protein